MNPAIGGLVGAVGQIADELFTSDEERGKLALQEREIEARQTIAVQEVNKAEAAHPDTFVAGWRPAAGWVCAVALGYQFILYPLLLWVIAIWAPHVVAPPELSAEALWTIVTGMLGIGGMRSWDKGRAVDTKRMGR